LNTVNAGSPNDSEEPTGGIPWLALLLGLVALIFIAITGPRLVGILFAIMAPPEPPVPENARLLGYNRQVYGIDTWDYDTPDDVCQLVTFYTEQGGVCPVMPPRCASESDRLQSSDDFIAICNGEMDFSIFALRWRFDVPVRSVSGPRVRFQVSREVFWLDDLRPAQP
jgi:hypothetical protein